MWGWKKLPTNKGITSSSRKFAKARVLHAERAPDRDVNRLGSRYFESGFGSAISSSYGCGQTHEAFTIDRVATYAEACAESNAMTSRGIVLAASEAE